MFIGAALADGHLDLERCVDTIRECRAGDGVSAITGQGVPVVPVGRPLVVDDVALAPAVAGSNLTLNAISFEFPVAFSDVIVGALTWSTAHTVVVAAGEVCASGSFVSLTV